MQCSTTGQERAIDECGRNGVSPPHCNGTMDRLNSEDSNVPKSKHRSKRSALLIYANLLKLTSEEETLEEEDLDPLAPPTPVFDFDFSSEVMAAGVPPGVRKASVTSPRSLVVSATDDQHNYKNGQLYEDEEFTEETQAMIQEVVEKGARVDACDALQSILETIISMVVLSRCTDSTKIFNAEDAQKKLEKFSKDFNDTQANALQMLFDLEEVDKVAYRLFEKSNNLKNIREDLLDTLENVDFRITEIEKTKPDKTELSMIFIDAMDLFRKNLPSLKEAASESHSQYGEYDSLRQVCQELKLGTLHEIVSDMKMELDALAKGELNDHIFYASKPRVANVKSRPSKHGHLEDRVDGLKKTKDTDMFLEQVGSIASLYLSSYVPELAGDNEKQKLSEDYIEFDISRVTRLVKLDDTAKKQLRSVYVHKKVNGILQHYQKLLQDVGYYRETNARLTQDNEDLRQSLEEKDRIIKGLQEQLDSCVTTV